MEPANVLIVCQAERTRTHLLPQSLDQLLWLISSDRGKGGWREDLREEGEETVGGERSRAARLLEGFLLKGCGKRTG